MNKWYFQLTYSIFPLMMLKDATPLSFNSELAFAFTKEIEWLLELFWILGGLIYSTVFVNLGPEDQCSKKESFSQEASNNLVRFACNLISKGCWVFTSHIFLIDFRGGGYLFFIDLQKMFIKSLSFIYHTQDYSS